MKHEAGSPRAYLDDLEGEQLAIVKAIRKAIEQVVPRVEEGIRYGMLDYPGVANLGAQKNHVALYVAPEILSRHKKAFIGVDAGKSCLRFKRLDQVDAAALVALLEDVRAFRVGGEESGRR